MPDPSFSSPRKFLAPKFVFGQGCATLAGRYARNLGGNAALLVSDPGVRGHGLVEPVRASLRAQGVSVVDFCDVSANPRDVQVMAGASVYAAKKCDMLVAVGGGSAMDCAKGIGIVIANGGNILDFEGADNVPLPGPPLICIPTTAGSAADVSQFAIITDTGRKVKIAIVSKLMVPDASLLDPELTVSMPPELTAHTGLDALAHAVEAYVSNASSPLTDILALEAVALIRDNLPKVVTRPDDIELRSRMLHACLLAGLSFSNAILGAVHAMAHSLGGYLDLPHGLCNALLLEYVIKCNYGAAPERFARLAEILGEKYPPGAPGGSLDEVVATFQNFRKACGVTQTLAQVGVKQADVARLSALAVLDPCMTTNPRALSAKDVEKIFLEALSNQG
ncbi:iron-containing alcohol dehydrogenase [Fundidesulfovibrio butyratiphilus]